MPAATYYIEGLSCWAMLALPGATLHPMFSRIPNQTQLTSGTPSNSTEIGLAVCARIRTVFKKHGPLRRCQSTCYDRVNPPSVFGT